MTSINMDDKPTILEYLDNVPNNFRLSAFGEYRSVLDQIDKSDELGNDDEVLQAYIKSIQFVGGIMSRLSDYDKAIRLYTKSDFYLNRLYANGVINVIEKNAFENMIVKCYNETGDQSRALIRARLVILNYLRSLKSIKNQLKVQDRDQRGRNALYIYLVMSLKDLSRYAKSISNSIGDIRSASEFFFWEKTFRFIQLRHLVMDQPSNYLLRNEHRASLPNDMNYLFMGTTLAEKKGFKIITHLWKMSWKLFFSLMSRLVCGYGERPVRVIITMVLVISSYAIAYDIFGLTDPDVSVWGSLYFSLVTFTSLGYGDIHPIGLDLPRIVAASEAAVGIMLISLFIFVLGRKVGR